MQVHNQFAALDPFQSPSSSPPPPPSSPSNGYQKRPQSSSSTSSEVKSQVSFGGYRKDVVIMSDLDAIDHAMVQLSRAFHQLVSVCPGMANVNVADIQDEMVRQRLATHRMQLAKSLKAGYKDRNLPIIDQLLNLDQAQLNGTQEPQKLSIAIVDKSSELSSQINKKKKQGKKWPPPIPPIENKRLEAQVFTHKSVANKRFFLHRSELIHEHNARLEFIGDAIINFVASDIVHHAFPNLPEGDLTAIRSQLVCNNTLWEWATAYKLDERLKTEFDIYTDLNGKRSKLVSDLMEAYIGGLAQQASERDQSYEPIQEWIAALIEPNLQEIIEQRKDMEPLNKEAKNELYTRIGSTDMPPEYITVVEGDNLHPFTVECRINGDLLGTGESQSKKTAGWLAAMDALKNTEKVEYYAELRRTMPQVGFPTTAPRAKTKATPTNAHQSSGPKDLLYRAIGSVENRPNYISKMINGYYYCRVYMHDDELGSGMGLTRKLAETQTASMAMQNRELITKWAQFR